MYPIILLLFTTQYIEESHRFGTWLHVGLLVLLLMLVINILNFKWSLDLFKRKDDTGQDVTRPLRGL